MCADDCQHYRIMNPNSVRNTINLACRVCNDTEQLRAHAAGLKVKQPARLSAGEQALLRHIDQNSIGGARRQFVREVKPFAGLGLDRDTVNSSVDVVVFEGAASACKQAMRAGLLVYWDGKQHRPDRQTPDQHQLDVDKRVSTAAAALGFHVLRISDRDAERQLSVIDAAWRARNGRGWVKVSPRWNAGAHCVVLWDACRARCEVQVQRAGPTRHCSNVRHLLGLAERL